MDNSFNAKAALNLWCGKNKHKVEYDITGSGSGHNPTFECQVKVHLATDKQSVYKGKANNKKNASNHAAFEALKSLVQQKLITPNEVSQPCYAILNVKEALFPSENTTAKPVDPSNTNAVNSTQGKKKNSAPPPAQSARSQNAENINPNNKRVGKKKDFWNMPLPKIDDQFEPDPNFARVPPPQHAPVRMPVPTPALPPSDPRFQRPPPPSDGRRFQGPPPPPCPRFRGQAPGRFPMLPPNPPPVQRFWSPPRQPRPPFGPPPPDFFDDEFHPPPPPGPRGPPCGPPGPPYGPPGPPWGPPPDHFNPDFPPPHDLNHYDLYGPGPCFDPYYDGPGPAGGDWNMSPPPPSFHHPHGPPPHHPHGPPPPHPYGPPPPHPHPGPYHPPPRFVPPPPLPHKNVRRPNKAQARLDETSVKQMKNLNINESWNHQPAVANRGRGGGTAAETALSDDSEDSISIMLREVKKAKFEEDSITQKMDQIKNQCNFTLDNSKQQLNIFFQLNRIKTDYQFESHGPPHSMTFIAFLKFYSWRNKKEYFAKEKAANKQDASRLCALNILYQLYNDRMVSEFDAEAPSKRQLLKTSWIYVLNVKKELSDHLLEAYSYVQSFNQFAKHIGTLKQEPEKPNKSANSFLYWCPPLENFNPWLNTTLEGTPFEGKSKEDIDIQLQNEFKTMIKSPKFQSVLGARMKLPIWEHKEKVIQMIESTPVVIIKGSTGCGKTTQVSQFILDSYIKSGSGSNCNIIVTQPRRISAISIAERVAYERGEDVKDGKSSVGYAVRFDHAYPRPYGSILFCTTGHLLRRIQGGLKGVSHLIIDEVHERDINTDLLLIIIRDLINLDLNIRVVIMSATLGVSHFQNYFKCRDVIQIESRVFPVERFFLEDTIEMIKWKPNKFSYMEDDVEVTDIPEDLRQDSQGQFEYPKSISQSTIETLQKLKEGVICFELIVALLEYIHNLTVTGSILIFLPGWNSIFSLLNYLKQHRIFGNESKFSLLPLHSQLSHKDNNRIFVQSIQRKIILSTNIAETSITIDDVVFVIDTCLMKTKIYDPRTNCTSFVVDWVSKSNIQQRQGRAGRVRSGYFFVLCTRKRFEMLDEFKKPDILVSSLVETVMLIKHLGFGSVSEFLKRALDPPSGKSVQEAMGTLRDINAFDQENELTQLGVILAKMPIDPRIGRMVIEGILLNVASPVLTIAAASSINFEMFDNNDIGLLLRTILQLDEERFSDHLIAFKVFSMCEKMDRSALSTYPCVNLNAINVVHNARKQLVRILTKCGFPEDLFQIKPSYLYKAEEFDKIAGLLITAFYPNVCIHKDTRRILTNEERIGLIHKTSVFYAYVNLKKLPRSHKLKSPMFIYSEKSQNKNLISSKQMTMVTFLQLLLFGIRTFEFPPNPTGNSIDTIILDGWIEIKIDAQVFDCIWQMKTEFEQLITRVCANPTYQKTELDTTVLNAISKLCLFENISVEIIGKQN